jgi:hypothetical protein
MVARFLDQVEQGYFYSFLSLQGILLFFELGLGVVIVQFTSHEMSKLKWHDEIVVGDLESKNRLACLFKSLTKWYVVCSILLFLILSGIGFFLFGNKVNIAHNIDWKIPWLIVSAGTALTLFTTPFLAVLEGCGKIEELSAARAIQSFVTSLILWLSLAFHIRLYSIAILSFLPIILGVYFVVVRYQKFYIDLIKLKNDHMPIISWRNEILPMQWRISLSWISAYMMYQMINPVLFRFHGPQVAGQYGMSLRIVISLQELAYSWVATKAPRFGQLVATGDKPQLRKLFYSNFWKSLIVFSVLSIGFLIAVEYAKWIHIDQVKRLLESKMLLLLCLISLVNCIVFSISTLTRSEKKEPFYLLSIINVILSLTFIVFGCIPYGVSGYLIPSLLAGLLVSIPISLKLLRQFALRHFP